ncbi:MAG TPA: sensor histidine kinase [Acidimicrobiales bacterium]
MAGFRGSPRRLGVTSLSEAAARPSGSAVEGRFHHHAFLYASPHEFFDGTVAFLEAGIAAGDVALVALSAGKIDGLRSRLGDGAAQVEFLDMADVGRNPAAIIPAWHRFVDAQREAGRTFRGIGEPIWASRSEDELVECERHEALLNLAFHDGPPWHLLCPYDVTALGADVLEEARRNHPTVCDRSLGYAPSGSYRGLEEIDAPFDAPLPDAPSDAVVLSFGPGPLQSVRRFVYGEAARFGLLRERLDDLVLAVSEVVGNSMEHGGGTGVVRLWHAGAKVVCEVRDAGFIADPLAGRRPARRDDIRGRGLWIANHLCDLVQVRTSPTGSVVRLHVTA